MYILHLLSIIFKLVHPSPILSSTPISSLPTFIVPCAQPCSTYCLQPASTICFSCLQHYFQTYNIGTQQCECRQNYELALNIDYYCCPYNCKSCGPYGCTSCWINGYLYVDVDSLDTTCVCYQNYYTDPSVIYCLCLSRKQPEKYYQDEQMDICSQCPQNCICTVDGCVSCNSSANRIIYKNKYNISTCHCIEDFMEIDYQCLCPNGCLCESYKIKSCSSESHRKYSDGEWSCSTQYADVNGQCVCDPSLYRVFETFNPYDEYQCLCDAHNLSLVKYGYEFQGQCRQCIYQCYCDETGCYKCDQNPSTVSVNNQCYCVNNFTYTITTCECETPFFWFQTSNGTDHHDNICYCLSQKYPIKYYYIQSSKTCLRCPQQCTCNQSGCLACSEHTLRQITKYTNGRSSCLCINNSEATEQDTCVCSYMFKYDAVTHSCVCDVAKKDFTFQDIDLGTCKLCPSGCICDQKGCYNCTNDLLRKISVNSIGRYTCYCLPGGLQQIIGGYCACPHPLVWDEAGQQCQCPYPYFMDPSRQCVCSSKLNSTKFYFDPLTSTCYECPFNCICNSTGCMQCSQDSLRFVMRTTFNVSVCRCKSYAFLINNLCLYCPISTYYYSRSCIPCLECLTCDKRGCLSCNPNTHLVNFSCVCNQSILTNVAGDCVCQDGFFYHPYKGTCEECPVYCNQCQFDSSIAVTIQKIACLSCTKQVHRILNPKVNCKCQDGYSQAFPQQQACCPISCSSCNSTSCFSCYLYTKKIIQNGQCVCPDLMFDLEGTCVCLDGYYLFDQQCKSCLMGCETCYFNYVIQQNICLQCKQGMNRNTSTFACDCLQGFQQTEFIKSQFCVAKYCLNKQIDCSQCIIPYIKNENTCICPLGTYRLLTRECQFCNKHKGCVECKNLSYCLRCDQSKGYYLTFPKCVELNIVEHILVWNQTHTIVQFRTNDDITGVVKVRGVYVRSIFSQIEYNFNYHEQGQQNNVIESFYFEEYQVILINNSTISVAFRIPRSFELSFLTVEGMFLTSSTPETGVFLNKTYNIQTELNIKSSPLSRSETIAFKIIAITGLVLSYVIHTLGYKNNQLTFLLQTLSFIGFKLDSPMNNIYICHELRPVYYNFDSQVFKPAFASYHFEESQGNYYFLTLDHNIFRVLGVTISIAFLNLFVVFILFVFLLINMEMIIYLKKLQYSRIVFRTIEFVYKTTMYPLIFFSCQNILNWSREAYLNPRSVTIGNIFSTVIVSIYIIATIIQYTSILTSNFYKSISFIEILSSVICSITIIFFGYKTQYSICVLILTIITKNGLYYYLRYKYLKDNCCFNPWNYLPFLIQSSILVMILYEVGVYVMLILLWGLIVVEGVVGYFIVREYDREGSYQKQKGYMKTQIGLEEETKNVILQEHRKAESQEQIMRD